jgi:uncharacterized SAM-binding protein YcdF (DUF218 family)
MRLNQEKKPSKKPGKYILILCGVVLLGTAGMWFATPILCSIGKFPVYEEHPAPSDAVVVLYTGVEYYPRLIEAARLYNDGLAKNIVINGNRKTDMLRSLEKKGFVSCCNWAEDYVRILGLFSVPRERIITVSAEDVFDTISEAEAVGKALLGKGMNKILLTTSKSHTRRARHIWNHLFAKKLSISVVSAKTDPYDPDGWWRDGRQIRWVLAEYGAWVYFWWRTV